MNKIIAILMLICTCSVAGAQSITEIRIVEEDRPDKVKVNGQTIDVYENLDEMPQYPGGINGLMTVLSENLHYPEDAMENNIQGKVMVKFVVTSKGDVANIEILNSVYPSLDKEAVRVVGLLNGFTPGQLHGENVNVWFTLPITFKLQNDYPEVEEFDVVEIDSIGYQQMMDLGLATQRENNLAHATAYFKEAYHINPYNIDPLERIVKMNEANGKISDNYAVYEYGVDQLSRWNQLNGTGNGAVFPMKWLAEQMQKVNPDDLYPQFALLWTLLKAPSEDYKNQGNDLLDKLIPIVEQRELWDQYGHFMSLKSFFLDDEDTVINYYTPNIDKLIKSPQGVGAIVLLSRIYEEKGDSDKASEYMRIAESADPDRIELPKWIEHYK